MSKERRAVSNVKLGGVVLSLLIAFLIPSVSYIYSKGQDNAVLMDLVKEMQNNRVVLQGLTDKFYVVGNQVSMNKNSVAMLDDKVYSLERVVGVHDKHIAVLLSRSGDKTLRVGDDTKDGSL